MLITRGIYDMNFITKSNTKIYIFFNVLSRFKVDLEVSDRFGPFLYYIFSMYVLYCHS